MSYKHLSTLTYAGGGEKTTTIRINRLLRNEFGDENSSLFFAKRKFSEQFKHRCYQEPISHAHTHTHTRHLSTSSQCQHYKIKWVVQCLLLEYKILINICLDASLFRSVVENLAYAPTQRGTKRVYVTCGIRATYTTLMSEFIQRSSGWVHLVQHCICTVCQYECT